MNVSSSPLSFRKVSDRVALSIAVIVAAAVTVPSLVNVCACAADVSVANSAATIAHFIVLMNVSLCFQLSLRTLRPAYSDSEP